jgi:hypothetical protein
MGKIVYEDDGKQWTWRLINNMYSDQLKEIHVDTWELNFWEPDREAWYISCGRITLVARNFSSQTTEARGNGKAFSSAWKEETSTPLLYWWKHPLEVKGSKGVLRQRKVRKLNALRPTLKEWLMEISFKKMMKKKDIRRLRHS